MNDQKLFESALESLNWAITTQSSNDLRAIKRYTHNLTPQATKDIIEALEDSFKTIESLEQNERNFIDTHTDFELITKAIKKEFSILEKNITIITDRCKKLEERFDVMEFLDFEILIDTIEEDIEEPIEEIKAEIKGLEVYIEDIKE